MNEAQAMKKEQDNWTELYHKTVKKLEAMINVQRQVRCYKMSMWTDFRVRVSEQKQDSSNYQSTTEKEHMTWKLCDRVQNGLEGLTVQKDQEESRSELGLGVMLRDMSSSWCTHGACMVMEIKEYDVRVHGYSMVNK